MYSIINNNKRAIATALAALIAFPSIAGVTGEGTEPSGDKEVVTLVMDPFFETDNQFESVTYMIYDHDDNLIYEKTLKKGESAEVKLVKLLNKSDFMTELSGTSYFRYNN